MFKASLADEIDSSTGVCSRKIRGGHFGYFNSGNVGNGHSKRSDSTRVPQTRAGNTGSINSKRRGVSGHSANGDLRRKNTRIHSRHAWEILQKSSNVAVYNRSIILIERHNIFDTRCCALFVESEGLRVHFTSLGYFILIQHRGGIISPSFVAFV